jgi:hypothetical protein
MEKGKKYKGEWNYEAGVNERVIKGEPEGELNPRSILHCLRPFIVNNKIRNFLSYSGRSRVHISVTRLSLLRGFHGSFLEAKTSKVAQIRPRLLRFTMQQVSPKRWQFSTRLNDVES